MHQEDQLERVFDRGNYMMGFRKDGIVHIYYKDNTILDVALQEDMMSLLDKEYGGKERRMIFEAGKNCSITKSARDNAIAMEERVNAVAYVVYVQNAVYRMIANFYYKFNKPVKPMTVVSEFEEGIQWLLAQVK